MASHTEYCKAQQLIQPYLHKISEWATANNLHVNTDQLPPHFFTSDPADYGTTLSLKLNNQILPTKKHAKMFGITLDPKLTFSQHLNITMTKQNKCLTFSKHSLLPNGVNKRN